MFELQQLCIQRWVPLGAATPNFGVLFRELHANRQHPNAGLRIVEKANHNPIMVCDADGVIKPFSHCQYSHHTPWHADFDPKPFDPFNL